jgi:hypothetical protein
VADASPPIVDLVPMDRPAGILKVISRASSKAASSKATSVPMARRAGEMAMAKAAASAAPMVRPEIATAMTTTAQDSAVTLVMAQVPMATVRLEDADSSNAMATVAHRRVTARTTMTTVGLLAATGAMTITPKKTRP